VWRNWQTR